MNFDELSYEELEKIQDEKIVDLKDIKHSIEKLTESANDIADIENEEVNRIYNDILQLIEDLDSEKISIELDLDDIESNMQMLEDNGFNDTEEREREYWKTQFRYGEI